jgi:hypothetical protein
MSWWRRRAPLGLAVFLLTVGNGHGADGLPPGWEQLPTEMAALNAPVARVVRISEKFLGTPYRADTLIGGPGHPEQLVIRFDAVDCFTFLDNVEALRRSKTPAEFRQRLAEVRYRDGVVAWDHRRHFFTDWVAAPDGPVSDVTAEVGGGRTQQTLKRLNRKADGTRFLPGVAVQERMIRFIPAAGLDDRVLDRLESGDYLGIYTPAAGLDVSHVGIIIRKERQLFLRHASSRREIGKVVDSDLIAYLAGKPGVVILRPR